MGRFSGVSWQAADTLSGTVDRTGETLTVDQRTLDWERRPVMEHCAVIGARSAHLMSWAPRKPHEEDPLGRQVYPLSRLGSLIPYSRKKRFWRKWIRRRISGFSLAPDARLGRCLLLGAYYDDCNNYYHFWADAIADFWFAKRSGVDTDSFSHILMPYSGSRWQREILDLCGIDPARVVPLSAASHFHCRELFLPLRPKGSYATPEWLPSALCELSGYQHPDERKRRIYVARLDAPRRRLINELEVIDLVRGFGFEVITGSDHSVAEQQRLFGEAAVVVAPHGAALTNLTWCAPNTQVLEFVPEGHHNPCFFDLSRACGLNYQVVQSRRLDTGRDEYELCLHLLRDFLQFLDASCVVANPV